MITKGYERHIREANDRLESLESSVLTIATGLDDLRTLVHLHTEVLLAEKKKKETKTRGGRKWKR